MQDHQQSEPGYTKTSLYLVGGLSIMTVLFVAAGIAGFDPIMGAVRALALVL